MLATDKKQEIINSNKLMKAIQVLQRFRSQFLPSGLPI